MMRDLSLKTRGELWLAALLTRFYRLHSRRLEDVAPQDFEVYAVGPSEAVHVVPEASIPHIIWAYWNRDTPPLLIQRCFENWHRFNPDFSINVLNDATLSEYLPEIAGQMEKIPVAKRSDWIRLELLHRYGGIWLDASTILTQSLDWVLEKQVQSRADFVGYYLERYTADKAIPVVESWFMAAPAGSAFIGNVRDEFATEAIFRSGAAYVQYLQARGGYEKIRQNIEMPEYLSIHLAMQVVLQGGQQYRLSLGKAEDGPYSLHVLGNWDRTPLKIRLMFSRIGDALPALIKLRNPDRKRLDEYLLDQLYVKDSIADRFL